MTPEELEKYIESADAKGLAKAVEKYSETDRKKLSKTAAKIYREMREARINNKFDSKEYYKAFVAKFCTSELAMFAFCPISTLRGNTPSFWNYSIPDASEEKKEHEAHEALIKVLDDRRPVWVDEWMDSCLDEEFVSMPWCCVRILMKKGICKKPTTDAYIRLMVERLPDRWHLEEKEYTPASEKLLADPELLEDEIWRIFEVENDCFSNTREIPASSPANYENWAMALRKLSDQGHLDRQRLLTASLDGLTTGFNRNALSSFIEFHNFMEPDLKEMEARQSTYLDLLSSHAPNVVTFALKKLKEIDKGKKLDDSGFVNAVSPVFEIQTKVQPKNAMQLLGKIIERSPDLGKQILNVICGGLLHESAEIQEIALKLMGNYKNLLDKGVLSVIAERSEDISPSNRNLVHEILGGQAKEAKKVTAGTMTEKSKGKGPLLKRIDKIPAEYKLLTGLDKAEEAINSRQLLPPISFNQLDVPFLPGLQRIQPIETMDELLDAVAHAIEVTESADEAERILDGISRMCDQRPADFEKRAKVFLSRMEEQREREYARGFVSEWNVGKALFDVVHSWLTGKRGPTVNLKDKAKKPLLPILLRLDELAGRLVKKKAAPLLSAPTHVHGWIEASVLAERLLHYQKKGIDLPKHDFIQALLRVAPDRTGKVINKCKNLKGVAGDIMRWLLNGEKASIKKNDEPFWIAAGRARYPYDSLDKILNTKKGDWGPDCLKPAKYSWEIEVTKTYYKVSKETIYKRKLECKVEPAEITVIMIGRVPTLALHHPFSYLYGSSWLYQWISMVWAQNMEPYYAIGVGFLADRIDMNSASMEPNYTFIEPLLEADRPISDMGCLALWLGLAGQDADARGYAMDVLAEGIQDGRIHPDMLSPVLVKLGKDDWIKLNRVGKVLCETAKLSPLHSLVIARTLEQWLENQDELSRDASHVLSALHEIMIELGISLSDKARKPLEKVKGSSKTAKLCKSLLNHAPDKPTAAYDEALQLQLESRIQRAERWQNG